MHPETNTLNPTTELIPLTTTDAGVQAVTGRDLHTFLEVGRDYTNWFKQMVGYGFVAGQDFTPNVAKSSGGRPRQDHILTLDMAKEISMIQRSEKGKRARQYFIECEKRAQQMPAIPQTYSEALRELAATVEQSERQAAELEAAAPKVEYHDQFVADEDLIQFRTLANQLNVGEQDMKAALVDRDWIYNDRTQRWSNKEGQLVWESRWRASASKKRYFRLVSHHKAPRINGEVRQTLKVTPKGAVAIARALKKWGLIQEVPALF